MTSQDLYRASQGNHERDCGYGGKKVGSKGFQGIDLGEIQDLLDTTPEEWTEDDLMEVSASQPVPDNEEENVEVVVPENKQTLDSLAEGFQLFKTAFDVFYNMDPSMCQHQMNKPF